MSESLRTMPHYRIENTGIFDIFERHEVSIIHDYGDICLKCENQTNLHRAKPKKKRSSVLFVSEYTSGVGPTVITRFTK